MNGILNINKPKDWTSHDVVARVRKILNIKKVGHTGTLDPLATGVLLLAIGKATKIIRFLPDDKVYRTKVRLGIETTSYDCLGDIVSEKSIAGITEDQVQQVLLHFVGAIEQIPPLYSAIKLKGKPLYKFARKGVVVDVPARSVCIRKLILESFEPPHLVLMVHCSAGTYIRSLAHDIGQELGCGGHVLELQRLQIGHFPLASATSLMNLTLDPVDHHLISVDDALKHHPAIIVKSDFIDQLKHGVVPQREHLDSCPDITQPIPVRLKSLTNELIAIATIFPEPFSVKLERVF